MTKRKLLQQALDALDHPCTINDSIGWPDKARELCDSIRAELAQPSATPTGYTKGYAEGFEDACQVSAHVKAANLAADEPLPDCRTCGYYGSSQHYELSYRKQCESSAVCINGDRYQSLPVVKLWRIA
jgi:hypothetical protein